VNSGIFSCFFSLAEGRFARSGTIRAILLRHQAPAGYKAKHDHAVRAPAPAVHGQVRTGPLHGTCRKAGRSVPRSALPHGAGDVANESRDKFRFQG
jgi:hypothetical protein